MSVQESHRPFPSLTPVSLAPIPVDAPAQPIELGARRHRVAENFKTAAIPPSLATGLALAFEFAALTIVCSAVLRWWISDALLLDWHVFGPVVGASLLTVLVLQATSGYDLSLLRRHQMRLGRVLFAWTAVVGIFAVVLVVGELAPILPRSWYPLWFITGVFTLAIASSITAASVNRLTRAGRLQRRAVIVGGGPLAESLIEALEKTGNNELKILGIFDDRADERSPESQQGYPKLGNSADLLEFAREAKVDLLIVSLPMAAETRLLQLLKKLWILPVDIRLAAHANKLRFRPRSYSYIGAVPFLDVFDRPIAGWDSVVKRIFDLTFASLAIVMLAPVMLLTALAIRLDSKGPVLFRQKRYGFNNEVISVLKFRSMYHHMADPTAKVVVTKGDARVTRVGRFIRKTSLDELPQLFNVLRGDLSLVGPRPHAVNAHTESRLWEEVVDGYFARHKVKPGVTGWAQINGLRGEVDRPEKIQGRVDHDLHYIENWSVLFDLYILILTPFRILNQENAY